MDQIGHTYYEGPGALKVPDAEDRLVNEGETVDITDVPAGSVVHGGHLRQVGRRKTHILGLDPEQCLTMQRSHAHAPLAPIEQLPVRRVAPEKGR